MNYAATRAPAWATDDRKLYVARAAQGPDEICGWIYRVEADGRGLHRITRGTELHTSPAVSPDGRLAFVVGDCQPGSFFGEVRVVGPAGRPTQDLRRSRTGMSTRALPGRPTDAGSRSR